jgi:hypothetical protein
MKIAIDINDVLRDFTSQFKNYYIKGIDPSFEIEDDEITSFDFSEIFPFKDRNAYNMFKYVDFAFELYGRAEPMDKMLPYRFNDWTQKTLKDLDKEYIPDIMLVSPFETGKSIQSTYAFLSKISSSVREIYFPVDSSTIWDRCDILITANPNLIENAPEGKTVVKIEMPYNKNVETKYTFKSLMDVINDENETIIKILTGEENGAKAE